VPDGVALQIFTIIISALCGQIVEGLLVKHFFIFSESLSII